MFSILKRTKSVTTLGPASNSQEQIQDLLENGSNCVRLNFSHGDHQEHLQRIVATREISKKLNTPIAIMLDTKGPEIRTHCFTGGSAQIDKNSVISIFDHKEILGNSESFSVNYSLLSKDVKAGDKLLIDDGKLQLKILEVKENELKVQALNTHTIKDRRAVNIPNVNLSLPFISEKDKQDLIFGCQQNVDFVAASFPSCKKDIEEIREILNSNNGSHIKIISKIESQLAVKNFDEILQVSDGIMVARGDLGVEIPFEEVPFYEHQWIKKCQKANKPVIVATQMLDSMTSNPHPTRAEVTDVYAAVQWGASSTMLSGESANGNYPKLAIATMAKIIQEAEKHYDYKQHQNFVKTDSLINSIIKTVEEQKVSYVVSNNCEITKVISNLHLPVISLPVLKTEREFRSLALNYGVYPLLDNQKGINEESINNLLVNSYNVKKAAKVLLVNGNEISVFEIK